MIQGRLSSNFHSEEKKMKNDDAEEDLLGIGSVETVSTATTTSVNSFRIRNRQAIEFDPFASGESARDLNNNNSLPGSGNISSTKPISSRVPGETSSVLSNDSSQQSQSSVPKSLDPAHVVSHKLSQAGGKFSSSLKSATTGIINTPPNLLRRAAAVASSSTSKALGVKQKVLMPPSAHGSFSSSAGSKGRSNGSSDGGGDDTRRRKRMHRPSTDKPSGGDKHRLVEYFVVVSAKPGTPRIDTKSQLRPMSSSNQLHSDGTRRDSSSKQNCSTVGQPDPIDWKDPKQCARQHPLESPGRIFTFEDDLSYSDDDDAKKSSRSLDDLMGRTSHDKTRDVKGSRIPSHSSCKNLPMRSIRETERKKERRKDGSEKGSNNRSASKDRTADSDTSCYSSSSYSETYQDKNGSVRATDGRAVVDQFAEGYDNNEASEAMVHVQYVNTTSSFRENSDFRPSTDIYKRLNHNGQRLRKMDEDESICSDVLATSQHSSFRLSGNSGINGIALASRDTSNSESGPKKLGALSEVEADLRPFTSPSRPPSQQPVAPPNGVTSQSRSSEGPQYKSPKEPLVVPFVSPRSSDPTSPLAQQQSERESSEGQNTVKRRNISTRNDGDQSTTLTSPSNTNAALVAPLSELITTPFHPEITSRYPLEDHEDNPLNPMVTHFCHPKCPTTQNKDKATGTSKIQEEIKPMFNYCMPKIHHFVLTNSVGKKMFGTCLTVWEPYELERETAAGRLGRRRKGKKKQQAGNSPAEGADAFANATEDNTSGGSDVRPPGSSRSLSSSQATSKGGKPNNVRCHETPLDNDSIGRTSSDKLSDQDEEIAFLTSCPSRSKDSSLGSVSSFQDQLRKGGNQYNHPPPPLSSHTPPCVPKSHSGDSFRGVSPIMGSSKTPSNKPPRLRSPACSTKESNNLTSGSHKTIPRSPSPTIMLGKLKINVPNSNTLSSRSFESAPARTQTPIRSAQSDLDEAPPSPPGLPSSRSNDTVVTYEDTYQMLGSPIMLPRIEVTMDDDFEIEADDRQSPRETSSTRSRQSNSCRVKCSPCSTEKESSPAGKSSASSHHDIANANYSTGIIESRSLPDIGTQKRKPPTVDTDYKNSTEEFNASQNSLNSVGRTAHDQSNVVPVRPLSTGRISTLTNYSRTYYLPRCLCVLSAWPYLTAFREYLTQLYRLYFSASSAVDDDSLMKAPIERYIVNLCCEIAAPPPGVFEVQCSIFNSTVRFWAPPANQPIAWVSLPFSHLFSCLSIHNILRVWHALALDRQILLVSSQISLLCICSEILISLLFPMDWTNLYIPVLPQFLTGMLDAPMPYLCGVPRDNFEEAQQSLSAECIVVDLDENTVKFGYETPPLPPLPEKRKYKLLKTIDANAGHIFREARCLSVEESWRWRTDRVIRSKGTAAWQERLEQYDEAFHLAFTPDSPNLLKESGTNDAVMSSSGSSAPKQSAWDAVQEAFLRFYVSILQDYRQFLIMPGSSGNHDSGFRTDAFIKASRVEYQPFLEELCRTQQFDSFITKRLYDPGEPDVTFFDQSIDAKRNRSKLNLKKVDTPFLSAANTHRQLHTIVALDPKSDDLPSDWRHAQHIRSCHSGASQLSPVSRDPNRKTFECSTPREHREMHSSPKWPETFDLSLFETPPRPVPSSIIDEFNRQGEISRRLRNKFVQFNESVYSNTYPHAEVGTFTVFFLMFSSIVGRELVALLEEQKEIQRQHQKLLEQQQMQSLNIDSYSSFEEATGHSSPHRRNSDLLGVETFEVVEDDEDKDEVDASRQDALKAASPISRSMSVAERSPHLRVYQRDNSIAVLKRKELGPILSAASMESASSCDSAAASSSNCKPHRQRESSTGLLETQTFEVLDDENSSSILSTLSNSGVHCNPVERSITSTQRNPHLRILERDNSEAVLKLKKAAEKKESMELVGSATEVDALALEEARDVAKAQLDLAFHAMQVLRGRGLPADLASYKCLIEACGRCGDATRATHVMSMVIEDGYAADNIMYNCLMDAFSITNNHSPSSFDDGRGSATSLGGRRMLWANGAHGSEIDWSEVRKMKKDANKRSDMRYLPGPTFFHKMEEGVSLSASLASSPTENASASVSRTSSSSLGASGTASGPSNSNNRAEGDRHRGGRRPRRRKSTNSQYKNSHLVTDPVLQQVVLGENLLELLYPNLVIDVQSETCPHCLRRVSEEDIIRGWKARESQDYNTTCPYCSVRFVARFKVYCDDPLFVGSKGCGTPLFCEFLSPWVLRKEMSNILLNAGSNASNGAGAASTSSGGDGIAKDSSSGGLGILHPDWRKGNDIHARLWWNMVVSFMKYRLPITFLLQGSFNNRLILPTPNDS